MSCKLRVASCAPTRLWRWGREWLPARYSAMARLKKLLAAAALAAAVSLPAPAQCVMCYLSAKSQNAARAHVLDAGIVILIIPPTAILAGFIWFVMRRNEKYRGE